MKSIEIGKYSVSQLEELGFAPVELNATRTESEVVTLKQALTLWVPVVTVVKFVDLENPTKSKEMYHFIAEVQPCIESLSHNTKTFIEFKIPPDDQCFEGMISHLVDEEITKFRKFMFPNDPNWEKLSVPQKFRLYRMGHGLEAVLGQSRCKHQFTITGLE